MERVVGCSILPISRDPQFHNIYVYLGRERRCSQWTDSDAWADFGGSTSANDLSPEMCAAREAWEESTCIMKFSQKDLLPLSNFTNIADRLQNKDFVMKVEVKQPDGATYITWVVEVPFDPLVPRRFIDWQKALRAYTYDTSRKIEGVDRSEISTHPALRNSRRANPIFLEKANIQLFSIPNLIDALENNGALLWRFGRSEYLRPSFMHRLAIVLEYFCPTFKIPRNLNFHSKPTISLYDINERKD